MLDIGHDPRLQVGDDGRFDLGAAMGGELPFGLPRRDERGALSGKKAVEYPALVALRIPDLPPVVEFLNDLDRQSAPHEGEGNVVILPRPATHVHIVRLEADEAGKGKPGPAGAVAVLGDRGVDGSESAEERNEDEEREFEPSESSAQR